MSHWGESGSCISKGIKVPKTNTTHTRSLSKEANNLRGVSAERDREIILHINRGANKNRLVLLSLISYLYVNLQSLAICSVAHSNPSHIQTSTYRLHFQASLTSRTYTGRAHRTNSLPFSSLALSRLARFTRWQLFTKDPRRLTTITEQQQQFYHSLSLIHNKPNYSLLRCRNSPFRGARLFQSMVVLFLWTRRKMY